MIRKIFHLQKTKRPKISLLIPFSSKDSIRKRNFKWLLRYWKHELPDAEIIIGKSNDKIFCKGNALNNAYLESRGKVVVILDADAYLSGKVIEKCADRILEEQKYGNNLWYVPYRHLYRLNEEVTIDIINSDPEDPLRLSSPPPGEYIINDPETAKYGARYGAMIMMFPREGYDVIGSFDERFHGWGGEDIALLRALDTLFGKHKTLDNSIFHFWHPIIGQNLQARKWTGQVSANQNSELAARYHRASRNPSDMRKLVNEGHEFTKKKRK